MQVNIMEESTMQE